MGSGAVLGRLSEDSATSSPFTSNVWPLFALHVFSAMDWVVIQRSREIRIHNGNDVPMIGTDYTLSACNTKAVLTAALNSVPAP